MAGALCTKQNFIEKIFVWENSKNYRNKLTMKKYKIKVLKDTPFDKAGTELSISDFRVNYNYICTNDVSDDDLIS